MKKIAMIALGACMFTATADAQKQTGGENNLQVLFAPLGGSPISLNGGGISFRKVASDGKSASLHPRLGAVASGSPAAPRRRSGAGR